MLLQSNEVTTIDEAFQLLPMELQRHSRRVAEYSRIAFLKICTMDLYVMVPRAERELVKENADFFYQAGLYHDIGKLLPDEAPLSFLTDEPASLKQKLKGSEGDNTPYVPKEHTIHGEELFMELYPNVNKMRVGDRNMILGGIKDHHEKVNGSGTPYGKAGEAISYSGRIVAIADMLDNIAMTIASEDPISKALKAMKPYVASGIIDANFFKAFSATGAKLKKVFSQAADENAAALPSTDQWIKRRGNRPMQLVYQPAEYKGRPAYYAEMRFRGFSKNDLLFEDVKKILTEGKLNSMLGEYFLYEICDALKRFRACGLGKDLAAMVLPLPYTAEPRLAEKICSVLKNEELSTEDLVLAFPEDPKRGLSKSAQKNLDACINAGLQVCTETELLSYMASQQDFETEEQMIKTKEAALNN